MEVHCITDKVEIIVKRNELKNKFYNFYLNSSISLKLFTCLDLSQSPSLKKKLNIDEFRYILVYFFHDLEKEELHYIAHPLLLNQTMTSFKHFWSALGHFENEVNLNFGIKFYSTQRIQEDFIIKKAPSLLDKDFHATKDVTSSDIFKIDTSTVKSEYDFQEFSLTEFGNFNEDVIFKFQTKGREVKSFNVCQDSYNLNLEKKIESLHLNEVYNFISHTNTKTPFAYQLILTEFIDYLEGYKKTFYQNAQMMLLNELSLIYDHLSALVDSFKVFQEVGAFKYLSDVKKEIYQLFLALDKFRPYPIINKSLNENFNSLWLREIVDFTQKNSPRIEKIKLSIISQAEYLRHSKNLVSFHPLKAGFTGLGLKSFGVSYDLRKNRPFYIYDQIELKVPLGISGSSYDRILIRMEETLESMSNLVRLIEGFPVYDGSEINAHELDYLPNEEDLFICLGQSGNGEIVYLIDYVHADAKIQRFHISTPSKRMLQSFENFYLTTDFEKISIDWISLGMSMSEVLK